MSNPFAITAAANSVSLDSNRQGQTSFTVSTLTSQHLRANARLVALSATAEPWLKLVGNAERDFVANGSQQYVVQITVPPSAPAGDYTLRLDMIDVANPDDNFSEGPAVKFTVPAPVVVKKPFPWWIVALIIGILIIVGGGIYGLVRVLNPPPSFCLQTSAPSLAITGIETGTDPTAQKVTLTNCGSAGTWKGTVKTATGGAWLASINPSGGTLNAAAKQDITVAVTSNPAGTGPLKAGTYTGTIVFTIGTRTLSVPVTFNVQPAPSVNPPVLTISTFQGGIRAASTLLTNNGGAGTVTVEVSTDDGSSWLSVNLASGTPISAGGQVNVTITTRAIFFAGGHTGHVKFIIQTSTGTASVTLTVHLNVIHF